MLKVSELDHILTLIEKNGNPGMTMLRLKKDSGMYGTRLTHFVEEQAGFFTLTENGQMVNINTMAEHRGDKAKILELYQKQLEKRKRRMTGAAIAIAVACAAALAVIFNSIQMA